MVKYYSKIKQIPKKYSVRTLEITIIYQAGIALGPYTLLFISTVTVVKHNVSLVED